MIDNPSKAIPLDVIIDAMDGDAEALSFILDHYRGYIRYLSIRPVKDEYGNEYLRVDEDMQHRLEAKLISSIVTRYSILPQ